MEEMKDIAPIHIVVVVQLPRIAGGCSDFVGFQGIYGRTTVLIIFLGGGGLGSGLSCWCNGVLFA